MSYKWMVSRLIIMMGGRVAEELTFGKNITSGASSDIEQATNARAMVTQWGFSDARPGRLWPENQQEVFLGHSGFAVEERSGSTAQKIDTEVRRLIDEAYTEARRILTESGDVVALAEGLLEYETLSGEEIKALLRGEKPARDMGDEGPSDAALPCPRPAPRRLRRRVARPKAASNHSRTDSGRPENSGHPPNTRRMAFVSLTRCMRC